MSEENRFEINTDLPEPRSPGRQGKDGNLSGFLLSPKSDGAQKLLEQQSPRVSKKKYDMLRKIYEKALEQKNALGQMDTVIRQKSQELDGYKMILAAKQTQNNNSGEAQQKISQKRNQIADLQNRLKNIHSNNTAESSHARRVQQLGAEINNSQQSIQQRNSEARSELINSNVYQNVKMLQQVVNNLNYKKGLTQNAINASRANVNQSKVALESVLSKLLQFSTGLSSTNKLTELQQKQTSFKRQIQDRIQQIQRVKGQLSFATNNQSEVQASTSEPHNIQNLKSQLNQLKRQSAQIEKAVQNQKKQYSDVLNKLKNNEKNIEKLKTKNVQLNDKSKKLEEQKNQLEQKATQGNKKPKYEQRVPDELINIRKKKQELVKQVRVESQRVQKERSRSDNLVPPTIIQNFKLKITGIHEKNQRFAKLRVQNETLVDENKKLDVSKEQLEWEINPDIKSNESNRLKEEGKCNVLQQEVSDMRKKTIQVTTKLEEYIKQYPDFKPERKVKKQEPAPQPQPVAAKKESQQEDKNSKKKKNSKPTSAQQVSQAVEQKPAPVVPQKAVKNQEPAKKSEPVIVAVKKQESPVNEQMKVDSKSPTLQQAKKNKKKR